MFTRIIGFTAVLALFSVQATGATPDHLLISEMSVRGGQYITGYESPEFVEIYNPTGSSVNLGNYILTDWAEYWRYPDFVRQNILQNEGTGDFITQFPADTLTAGSVVVVTVNAKQFLLSFFNPTGHKTTDLQECLTAFNAQPGSPKLYETYDSMPEIPNMINRNGDLTSGSMNMSHSDGGENMFMFYYDGTSDTVKDVDMVFYKKRGTTLGTDNGLSAKSEAIDGPDADPIATSYLADNGNEDNLSLQYASASGPYQVTRRSKFEPGENATGGNGLTGHDETMEIANVSFVGLDTTYTATAGVVHPGLTAADQQPAIYNGTVTPEIPTVAAPFTISTNIWDDGSIVSATAYISDGATTTSHSMTHGTGEAWSVVVPGGTYPDRTVLTWYVVATDNTGNTVSEWNYADFGTVGDPAIHRLRIDNAPADGLVVINEIQFDPNGSDNSTNPEFVEYYNTSANPLDLSGYYHQYGSDAALQFPNGTVIGGNDYLVLVYNATLFATKYPAVPSSKVLVIPDSAPTASVMANSGTGTIVFRAFDNSAVIDTVAYRVTPPWPGNTVSGSNYAASNTNYTIELVHPSLDNSDGANWVVSSILGGTPGENNFSMDSSRTIINPTTTDAVIITARLSGTHTAAANSVKLTYKVNGGADTVLDMTDLGSNNFSANLGTFADRSFITYNIVAQDSQSALNITASPTQFSFIVTDQAPITENDIVINELLVDPTGTDNGTGNSEWIEFYNTRSTAVNLGHMLIGPDNANAIEIPEGFIVQPGGYFILAGNKTKFTTQYGSVDSNIVINAAWPDSKLAQSGTPVRVVTIDPNQVMINRTNQPGDIVAYGIATPWPFGAAKSIELKNPTFDNNAAANWTLHSGAGTPGAVNSNLTASVSNWTLY